ncbi:hypothetical protein [Endozoicomonas elysicola]|uniref:Uncharacterized protein n=1 Tax=Endozoicomonas elysicola TaxID=305900 RepID=A0A081KFI1_9GAMM|nr:hypothetical protein [Endozoicomonas elysicola]KEI72907.1 hypothetical protein GV64_21215 [Endozoicomonas elysicola]
MINKQLYLFVVTGLLIVGGAFSTTRALAAPLPAHESVPSIQYWNIIADHLAKSLISRGRLGENTIYVDKKHTALDVTRYLEKQLSMSLKKSGASVSAPNIARYVIELDVEINERSDGHGTTYAEGGDIDQLWRIQELDPVYSGQYAHYQMVPLAMDSQGSINPLAGSDTEIIITARIMERGWIRISQNYAFYFTAESLRPARKPSHEKKLKAENDFEIDAFREFQNHHRVFLDYQNKLDADAQQLIDRYQF